MTLSESNTVLWVDSKLVHMIKKDKIQLPNVTLAAVTSVLLPKTIKALKYSMRGIDFGDVVLVTHEKPWYLPKDITYKHIEKIDDINKFNYMMAYDMHQYIDTEYMLLIHYDGFVVNPSSWTDDFLQYDYIGAPWRDIGDTNPPGFRDADGDTYRVGNSVSLRSKKFMKAPSELGFEWKAYDGWFNEDTFLCIQHHKDLEQYGCRFAPVEVAARYSRELLVPEAKGIEPLCFHKYVGDNDNYPHFSNIPFIRW